jgi:23S rRNA pseudouridine2605 synthase
MSRGKKKVMQTRINKYISDSGVASRRKAEEYIMQGRVTVNNKVVTNLSFKVDDVEDIVKLDGEKISPRKHLYYLLNKPEGFITSTKDEKSRRVVTDLIKTNERIYPVGRLDYNTKGVLLLTNDGAFFNLLTHPKNKVPREYEAKLDKDLSDEDKERLLRGVMLDEKQGRFNKISFPKNKNKKLILVVTTEGRNHFVKRMFDKLGYNVASLERKSFAGIKADIPLGSYRKLSYSEVKGVFKQYGN